MLESIGVEVTKAIEIIPLLRVDLSEDSRL